LVGWGVRALVYPAIFLLAVVALVVRVPLRGHALTRLVDAELDAAVPQFRWNAENVTVSWATGQASMGPISARDRATGRTVSIDRVDATFDPLALFDPYKRAFAVGTIHASLGWEVEAAVLQDGSVTLVESHLLAAIDKIANQSSMPPRDTPKPRINVPTPLHRMSLYVSGLSGQMAVSDSDAHRLDVSLASFSPVSNRWRAWGRWSGQASRVNPKAVLWAKWSAEARVTDEKGVATLQFSPSRVTMSPWWTAAPAPVVSVGDTVVHSEWESPDATNLTPRTARLNAATNISWPGMGSQGWPSPNAITLSSVLTTNGWNGPGATELTADLLSGWGDAGIVASAARTAQGRRTISATVDVSRLSATILHKLIDEPTIEEITPGPIHASYGWAWDADADDNSLDAWIPQDDTGQTGHAEIAIGTESMPWSFRLNEPDLPPGPWTIAGRSVASYDKHRSQWTWETPLPWTVALNDEAWLTAKLTDGPSTVTPRWNKGDDPVNVADTPAPPADSAPQGNMLVTVARFTHEHAALLARGRFKQALEQTHAQFDAELLLETAVDSAEQNDSPWPWKGFAFDKLASLPDTLQRSNGLVILHRASTMLPGTKLTSPLELIDGRIVFTPAGLSLQTASLHMGDIAVFLEGAWNDRGVSIAAKAETTGEAIEAVAKPEMPFMFWGGIFTAEAKVGIDLPEKAGATWMSRAGELREKLEASDYTASAKAYWRDGSWAHFSLPNVARNVTATLRWEGAERIHFDEMTADLGRTPRARMTGWIDWSGSHLTEVFFKIDAEESELTEWFGPWYPISKFGKTAGLPAREKPPGVRPRGSPPDAPPAYDVVVTVNLDVNLRHWTATDPFNQRIALEGDNARLLLEFVDYAGENSVQYVMLHPDTRLGLFGAQDALSIQVDLSPPDKKKEDTIEMIYRAKGMSMQRLAAGLDADAPHHFTGTLDTVGFLNAPLGARTFTDAANGAWRVDIDDSPIFRIPLLDEAMDAIGLGSATLAAMGQAGGTLIIDNAEAYTTNLTVRHPVVGLLIQGKTQLRGGALDGRMIVRIADSELVQNTPLVGPLAEMLAGLLDTVANPLLSLRIGGTVRKPIASSDPLIELQNDPMGIIRGAESLPTPTNSRDDFPFDVPEELNDVDWSSRLSWE